MSERDPDNADYYAANYDAFAALDRRASTRRCGRRSPRSPSAKLLTYHDAYAYFAETYGWDGHRRDPGVGLRGPDAKEVADLIDQVEAEERAGDLRLRGVPVPGARADRQGDRRRVRRRAARRRPARRARRRRALVARADALRLRDDDRGARRRRRRRSRRSTSATSRPTRRSTRSERRVDAPELVRLDRRHAARYGRDRRCSSTST